MGTPEEVLTAENITEAYGVRCRIIEDDSETSNTNIPPAKISAPHIILGVALVVDDEE